MDLAVILSIGFIAAVATCISGFGAGPISLLLLSLRFDIVESLSLSGMIVLSTSLSKTISLFRYIHFHDLIWLIAAAVGGSFLGALLATSINEIAVKVIVCVILSFVVFHGLRETLSKTHGEPTSTFKSSTLVILCGLALAGFASGFSHAAGGILNFFVSQLTRDRRAVIATVAAVALSMNLMKQAIYMGNASGHSVSIYAMILAVAAIGTLVGRDFVESRLNDNQFARINILFLAVLLLINVLSIFYDFLYGRSHF